MEDVLESFSAVMRREAARRARDVAADLKRRGADTGHDGDVAEATGAAAASPEEEKARLRRMYLVPAASRGQVAAALTAEETGT